VATVELWLGVSIVATPCATMTSGIERASTASCAMVLPF
jgi:hypothetical protein